MPGEFRIFIVEDDTAITEALKKHLRLWNYDVRSADDFMDVLRGFAEFDPHLVLMDIILPFYNGYHWCREIRRISPVPIVFLSSASDNMNIITAIDQGGDDFIAKPVDLNVLTAKLQAILRRAYGMPGKTPVIEYRGAVLDIGGGFLTVRGERTELTKNEFRILRTLMENRGQVISRSRLMNDLWQDDCYVEENTLTVNVARLRKKLESAGLEGYIITKPGSGYMIP